MTLNEAIAKLLLRAALDLADGQVGRFVPLGELVIGAGLSDDEAASTLDPLAARRFVHIRDGCVAVSSWGLEYGMDWAHVGALLRVILNSAGGIGMPAQSDVVVAASGLAEREVNKLVSELAILGLAAPCGLQQEGSDHTDGMYITRNGWEYLNNGGKLPEVTHSLGAGNAGVWPEQASSC